MVLKLRRAAIKKRFWYLSQKIEKYFFVCSFPALSLQNKMLPKINCESRRTKTTKIAIRYLTKKRNEIEKTHCALFYGCPTKEGLKVEMFLKTCYAFGVFFQESKEKHLDWWKRQEFYERHLSYYSQESIGGKNASKYQLRYCFLHIKNFSLW